MKPLKNTTNFDSPVFSTPATRTNSNDINSGVGLQIHLSKKAK